MNLYTLHARHQWASMLCVNYSPEPRAGLSGVLVTHPPAGHRGVSNWVSNSNFPAMPFPWTGVESPSLICLPAEAKGSPAGTAPSSPECQIGEHDGWRRRRAPALVKSFIRPDFSEEFQAFPSCRQWTFDTLMCMCMHSGVGRMVGSRVGGGWLESVWVAGGGGSLNNNGLKPWNKIPLSSLCGRTWTKGSGLN